MEGRQFNRRTLAILVVLTALLLLFFGVLYNLQVLHVDDYRAQSVVKIANRKTVEAARGELLDRYGRSMVTNRATYQLTLNTGVMGEEAVRNANLLELLNICRDNGLTWTDTLAVSTAAPFTYTSDTPLAYEKEGGGVALTRLGRLLNALPMKKELKSSLNLPTTEQVEDAKTLDDIPAGPTAEELIAALRTYFEIDPSWSDADARALIGVLYETNLRTYSINQQAYIFAQDVNIDVISAVKERRLTGVTIETTTVRQYNTVAAAHLLGHVGDIQSSNWDYYREQGYTMNDKASTGRRTPLRSICVGSQGFRSRSCPPAERWSASTGASTPRPERSRSPSRGTTFCSLWTSASRRRWRRFWPTPSRLWSRRIPGAARWWWRASRQGRSWRWPPIPPTICPRSTATPPSLTRPGITR